MTPILIVAASVGVLLLLALIALLFYALHEMQRVSTEAFKHLQARSLEEKVRADHLDTHLDVVTSTPKAEKEQTRTEQLRELIRNGEIETKDGTVVLL